MAKATASPPARRRSGDRPRGKAKTPKHKTTETSQPKHESPRKHEINRGFIAPFLLTRSVHFHAAIWHNLSPPLTSFVNQPSTVPILLYQEMSMIKTGFNCLNLLRAPCHPSFCKSRQRPHSIHQSRFPDGSSCVIGDPIPLSATILILC